MVQVYIDGFPWPVGLAIVGFIVILRCLVRGCNNDEKKDTKTNRVSVVVQGLPGPCTPPLSFCVGIDRCVVQSERQRLLGDQKKTQADKATEGSVNRDTV